MVDLPALFRQLEFADFVSRQQLAQAAASSVSAEQLPELTRALAHPTEKVRLGIIEVLWRSGQRGSIAALLAHAQQRTGDDRVFAIRALVQLARPEDETLHAPARAWLRHDDPFVQAQARLLANALALGEGAAAPAVVRAPSVAPGVSSPGAADTISTLVAALLAARTDSERIALVSALERRGPADLAAGAQRALPAANGDAVALLCRALIRQARALPGEAPARLIPLLEAARTRLHDWPLALAGLDDALIALEGDSLSAGFILRLARNDPRQLEGVLERLHDGPPSDLALQAPVLLEALAERAALWPALGPLLVDAAPLLREAARVELRARCEAALDELRRGAPLEPLTLLSVCWILAHIVERGWPVCRQLRQALERLGIAEGHHALCALLARVATEEGARGLQALLADPLPEVRSAAREALRSLDSPWVKVSFAGEDQVLITTEYRTAQGQLLSSLEDRLCTPGGEDYALDPLGQPVRVSDSDQGACLCCRPPRTLLRRKEQGLRCPASWESYLRDGGRVVAEREHPLGRCRQCESVRPRVREASRIVCRDCGFGRPLDQTRPDREGPGPRAFPSERAGSEEGPEALPRPPTPEELALITPHIRAAITANVFLLARDGDHRWSGSGIILARDDEHLAILTNRHVVESDDGGRLAAMRALTVAGELVEAQTEWRFGRGVDLALVTARVRQTEPLGRMALGQGAGLVGAPVFAVGNPLGLAWSYISGTLSAIRHWTTAEGQSVRILQTDAPLAPGASGGGLFHSDGHLLGVISFLTQGHAGASAHFALSVDAIRAAFTREDLRWRGRDLAAWTTD